MVGTAPEGQYLPIQASIGQGGIIITVLSLILIECRKVEPA